MDLERAKQTIIDFIRNKTAEAGVDGAVVGISGGIDSALSAYLTAEALGPENVLGIHLPEAGMTPEEDGLDSKQLAEQLGIEFKVIEISEILSAYLKSIPGGEKAVSLAKGNLKARIRMSVLYFHANQLNRMVIGTGNKTEILIGYYTKYGDGGVDIEPIGDLYKTEVWELSKMAGIPASIINKKPSAGLWKGQTDEAELGISYQTVDRLLQMLEKKEKAEIIIENLQISSGQYDSVLKRIRNNLHKRSVPPIAELKRE